MTPSTVRMPAGSLSPGDRFRYFYSGKSEGFVTVATVEVRPCFNPDYPNQVELQLEHPKRGRIAGPYPLWVDTELEVIPVKPLQPKRRLVGRKSVPNNKKRRLVGKPKVEPEPNLMKALSVLLRSVGKPVESNGNDSTPVPEKAFKPRIKRKVR